MKISSGPTKLRDHFPKGMTDAVSRVVTNHASDLGTWSPYHRSGGRISETMVWDFLACVKDGNPAHWSDEWASLHGIGSLTVPPQMLLTHSRFPPGPIGTAAEWEPDYVRETSEVDPLQTLMDSLCDEAGLNVYTNAFRREKYLSPIYPGDFLITSVLIEVSPIKQTRLAPGVFVNTKAQYRRAEDTDVVAESENSRFVYNSADATATATPQDVADWRSKNGPVRSEINVRPQFMSRPEATVKVSDVLPTLDFSVDFMDLIRAAQGTRHPVPMHTDKTYAVAAGNRDAYFSTLWQAGVLGRYITDWSGPKGQLTELDFTMLDNIGPGDQITVDGYVTSKSGGIVSVDILMGTQRGITTKAIARVGLPSEPRNRTWC
jgi:acyl dehydratase